jgi:hypothetical protein
MIAMFITVDPHSSIVYLSNTYTHHRDEKNFYSFNQTFLCYRITQNDNVIYQEIIIDIKYLMTMICIPYWTIYLSLSSNNNCITTIDYEFDFTITKISDRWFLKCKSLILIWIRVKWRCSTKLTLAITSSHDDFFSKVFKSSGILPECFLCHNITHYLFLLEII